MNEHAVMITRCAVTGRTWPYGPTHRPWYVARAWGQFEGELYSASAKAWTPREAKAGARHNLRTRLRQEPVDVEPVSRLQFANGTMATSTIRETL